MKLSKPACLGGDWPRRPIVVESGFAAYAQCWADLQGVDMHDTPSLTSRWRAAPVAVSLLLASAPSFPNPSTPPDYSALQECEPPLSRLIAILESKHQLAGTKTRYKGAPLGDDYSKCRIPQQRRSWPRYAVFRSRDNVTVVVEKQASEQEEPVLYGPFQSAYRK